MIVKNFVQLLFVRISEPNFCVKLRLFSSLFLVLTSTNSVLYLRAIDLNSNNPMCLFRITVRKRKSNWYEHTKTI